MKWNQSVIKRELYLLGVVLYVFFLIGSTSLFFVGFHNVDLGQNMRFLKAEYDITFKDYSNIRQEMSMADMIIAGNNQQFTAFFMFGICSLGFGWALFNLGINFNVKEEEKPKEKPPKVVKEDKEQQKLLPVELRMI